MQSERNIQRYLGMSVIVQTYGRQRILGVVHAVDDDSVLMTNTQLQNDDVELSWSDWMTPPEECHSAFPETLIPLQSIQTITPFEPIDLSSFGNRHDYRAISEAQVVIVESAHQPICDPVTIEVGSALVSLVATKNGLLDRITRLRRTLSETWGFEVPPIRVRDNVRLGSNEYTIQVSGAVRSRDKLYPDKMWVVGSAIPVEGLKGTVAPDPITHADGLWIDASAQHKAESRGLTVVDASVRLVADIQQTLEASVELLLSVDEVQRLVDLQRSSHPECMFLVQDSVSRAALQGVLRQLLADGIRIHFLHEIVASIARAREESFDRAAIISAVRRDIGHRIVEPHRDDSGVLRCLTIDAALLEVIEDSSEPDEPNYFQFRDALVGRFRTLSFAHEISVVVVPARQRPTISRLLQELSPRLIAVSNAEIPCHVSVQSVVTISAHEIMESMSSNLSTADLAKQNAESQPHAKPTLPLQINTNVGNLSSLRAITKTRTLTQAIERLSTGLKIKQQDTPEDE